MHRPRHRQFIEQADLRRPHGRRIAAGFVAVHGPGSDPVVVLHRYLGAPIRTGLGRHSRPLDETTHSPIGRRFTFRRMERRAVALPDDPPPVVVVEPVVLMANQRRVERGQSPAETIGRIEVSDLAPLRRNRASWTNAAAVTQLERTPQPSRHGTHLATGFQGHLLGVDQDPGNASVGEQPTYLVERQYPELVDLHLAVTGRHGLPVDRDCDVRPHRMPLRRLARPQGDVAHLHQRIGGHLLGGTSVANRDVGAIRAAKPLHRCGDQLRVGSSESGREVQHPVGTGGHPHRPSRTAQSFVSNRDLVSQADEPLSAELGELDRVHPRGRFDELAFDRRDRIAVEVAQHVRRKRHVSLRDRASCECLREHRVRTKLTRRLLGAPRIRVRPVEVGHELIGRASRRPPLCDVASVLALRSARLDRDLTRTFVDRPDEQHLPRGHAARDHLKPGKLVLALTELELVRRDLGERLHVTFQASHRGSMRVGPATGRLRFR
jgi:hypothetical protein